MISHCSEELKENEKGQMSLVCIVQLKQTPKAQETCIFNEKQEFVASCFTLLETR